MALTTPTNDLTGNTIASTYDQLLFIDGTALTNSALFAVACQDGETALRVANDQILIKDSSGTDIASLFEVQDKDANVILSINGTNNRVGIGTDAPNSELDIYQDNDGDTAGPILTLTRHSDSVADADVLGKILFRGRDDGGGYESYSYIQATILDASNATEDGYLEFGSQVAGSGATRMVVGYNGNVGIGTASPGVKLEVSESTSADCVGRIVGGSSNHSILELWSNAGASADDGWRLTSANGAEFSISESKTAGIGGSYAWDSRLTILEGGNVGIGTASPETSLEIEEATGGRLSLSTTDSGNNTIESGDALGYIQFRANDDGISTSSYGCFIKGIASGEWGTADDANDSPGELQFFTQSAGIGDGTSTARMVIDRDGNVGIGTATPETALQINTSDNTTIDQTDGTNSNTNANYNLLLKNSSVTQNSFAGIAFDVSTENDEDSTSASIAAIRVTSGTDTDHMAHLAFAVNGTDSADGKLQEAMRILNTGYVGIGEDIPDANLCIGQGAGDGKALTFKSSDISHAFTSYSVGGVAMEADTYGAMLKGSPTNGGLEIQGTTEGAYRALILQGNLDGTPNNTHTASGLGAVEIRGTVEGSNTAGTIGSGKNILSIAKGLTDVTVFIVDADGNYWFDGAAQTAFDSYDDAHLIRAFDVYNSPNDIIQTKFDDFLKYKKSALEDSGILYKMSPEEKAEGQKPFICGTRLQKLHNGAIWQQYTELEKMKELMYDAMVELMGKERTDKKLNSHDIKLLAKDLLN